MDDGRVLKTQTANPSQFAEENEIPGIRAQQKEAGRQDGSKPVSAFESPEYPAEYDVGDHCPI